MVTVFVPPYEWGAQYSSIDEMLQYAAECGETYAEGEEFDMIRLEVGAKTTYRMVDGKAVPIVVSFPEASK